LVKRKYISAALLLISLITISLMVGCAGQRSDPTTPVRSYNIVKSANITDSEGTKWQIYQLTLSLGGGGTFTLDLNLAAGNKVDCWYNVEQPTIGGSVNFQVEAGTLVIYPPDSTTASVDLSNTSDRLSFTATQVDGTSYRLVFHNNLPDTNSDETIYTEITCPANTAGQDSIFVPIGAN
jgi:hypothetical protein